MGQSTTPTWRRPPQRPHRILNVEGDQPVQSVREGLPFTAYERVQSFLSSPASELAAVLSISERTLARRKREGHLTKEESDRLVRLARLGERAVEVFDGDKQKAVRWLKAPKSVLQGETPLERADTEPGAREVEDMLHAIEYTAAA